ncbi:MAG: [Oscillospiraceae bacterium]|nr:[FeFe] hydrogenase H-cluster maturation GTPase HydF [Oscillospiraceae bacterium]
MAAPLNGTPSAERIHIGFFGKMNSGKSSLINAVTGQGISIVSDTPGTTTDPVSKAMEISGLGACLLTDTAGFDDTSELGGMRVEKTSAAAMKTDIAVVVFSDENIDMPLEWYNRFREKKINTLAVTSKYDTAEGKAVSKKLTDMNIPHIKTSAADRTGIDELIKELARIAADNEEKLFITGDLVSEGDTVLLVMPQDIQAPKGRLILPQVQTTRELLDRKCTVISTTADMLDNALKALSAPPDLIITDSQVFRTVYDKKPSESRLTSFSTLFAAYKGDIKSYIKGAAAINKLTESSRVLIAECCTHAPKEEDIGRVKLPRLLRKKAGEGLTVDIVGGADFPEVLTDYDLIIQCGACMFNRRHVLSRIERAASQNVPITNYGIAIAHISGILDKVEITNL